MKIRLLQASLFFKVCILLPFFSNAQVLTMTPGSHFVVNGSPSVIVNSAGINNNGTFSAASGTVVFTGYSDTSVSYITGNSSTTINNLTINKPAHGVAIKGAVGISNTLTMSTGNLYANSKLTLLSTASNTANVAPVAVGSNIFGKANVQRYFPAHRSWRLTTAPVTNSNTIYSSWQNGGIYAPGIGTYITGPSPSASNGLDASPQNGISMYTFNTAGQFVGVTNTLVNVSKGNSGNADNTGYMFFVRGDRAAANFNTTDFNTTTISALGNLQTGAQTFTASSVSGKYTLIGNPYASSINFGTTTRTNLMNRFFVWDPYLNTVGGFVTFDDIANTGTYVKSVSGSKETSIIQSGQAFFVQTNANGPASLTINESDKSSTNNSFAFRPASAVQSLTANLYLLNADSSTTIADGTVAQFSSDFSDSVTLEDAPKLSNMNENFSFLKNTKSLSIERDPLITLNDTLFFKLAQTTMRNYQIELIGQGFPSSSLTGFLQDTYLGTSMPINLAGDNTFNFSMTTAASAVTNRFRIVFNISTPLAVTFTAVKAYQKNTGIDVEWDVSNELNIAKYEVERSSDGTNFTVINTTPAIGNNNSTLNYNWLDADPLPGNNYYRIESIEKSGTIKYSQVVRVTINATGNNISVYPNPVTGNTMNLQFSNEPLGVYQIHLINSDGQIVDSKEITVSSNSAAQSISISSALARGSYELKISGPNNVESVQSIIIE